MIATLVSVTTTKDYIQETLDMYTDERCRIMILRPQDCGRRIRFLKEKHDDLKHAWLAERPYMKAVINLERQEYRTRKKDKKNHRIRQMLYPGFPCHKCLELIPVDSKCVVKKGATSVKSYHYKCAREVNVI